MRGRDNFVKVSLLKINDIDLSVQILRGERNNNNNTNSWTTILDGDFRTKTAMFHFSCRGPLADQPDSNLPLKVLAPAALFIHFLFLFFPLSSSFPSPFFYFLH